ncbi:hypothetical protein [Candidatus Thioglobus sp.]|uniref:hypothetical protein n=1 Tax=Candidatus Thioglobus sp. TaxID=2026721 RepID=UPI003D0BC2FB
MSKTRISSFFYKHGICRSASCSSVPVSNHRKKPTEGLNAMTMFEKTPTASWQLIGLLSRLNLTHLK